MKALITRKIGMTSTIAEDGTLTPVTLLSVAPNIVTQIRTEETDGYTALQLGTEEAKKPGKSLLGHFKKAGEQLPKIVREFRISKLEDGIEAGTEYTVDTFETGDIVHAVGISKGKGFAGTIKRHNFHRGRKTHGGRSYRRPGSIGSMYPQKIFKGKKMSGHMGNERVTVRNLKVALVDTENNVLGIAGAVPGPRKGIVMIRGAAQ